jgi:murein DD-endopeptidase MepM/ murein hydrolase activator NlpD
MIAEDRKNAGYVSAKPGNVKVKDVEKAQVNVTPAYEKKRKEEEADMREFNDFSSPVKTKKYTIVKNPRFPTGITLALKEGTEVYPVGPGKVILVKSLPKYGNTVIIKHSDNTYSAYHHLSKIGNIKLGDTISRKTVLGYVGKTGGLKAPQLHFTVTKNNKSVDIKKDVLAWTGDEFKGFDDEEDEDWETGSVTATVSAASVSVVENPDSFEEDLYGSDKSKVESQAQAAVQENKKVEANKYTKVINEKNVNQNVNQNVQNKTVNNVNNVQNKKIVGANKTTKTVTPHQETQESSKNYDDQIKALTVGLHHLNRKVDTKDKQTTTEGVMGSVMDVDDDEPRW